MGINSLGNRDLWFAVSPNAAISANPVFSKQDICERNSHLAGPMISAGLLWEQSLSWGLEGAHSSLSATGV